MSYGYLGVTPNQKVANNGVFSITEVNDLIEQGSWGGSLELIQSQTVSSVSAVDYTSIKESKYDVHLLTVINFQPATDNVILSYRLYESGSLETASVYKEAYQEVVSDGSNENTGAQTSTRSASNDEIRIGENVGNASLEFGTGYFYIWNAGNSTYHTSISSQSTTLAPSNEVYIHVGGGVLPQASTVDGFRIYPQNDATAELTGTVSLYGVAQ